MGSCPAKTPAPRERFVIELASEPGWTVPVDVRVRRACKTLLRTFGLRIVDYRAVATCPAETPPPAAEAAP